MFDADGERVGRITASFGVAQLPHNEDAEGLLRRADASSTKPSSPAATASRSARRRRGSSGRY
jgi:hypothetical protein